MKTKHELNEIMSFVIDYATKLLGSGVHTSRVVRNSHRIGEALGVDVSMSTFQKSAIITLNEKNNDDLLTRVVPIPDLPISFQMNSDLSALSWDALDSKLPLAEIKRRFKELTGKKPMNPLLVMLFVGLANAAFCRLFQGDFLAMAFVFVSTVLGFWLKDFLLSRGVAKFMVFMAAALISSACASLSLNFNCTANIAIATSPLYLVPGVPLINGFIDIVEGYVLIGTSRLINAMLLVICIAAGLSITLMIVKNNLL